MSQPPTHTGTHRSVFRPVAIATGILACLAIAAAIAFGAFAQAGADEQEGPAAGQPAAEELTDLAAADNAATELGVAASATDTAAGEDVAAKQTMTAAAELSAAAAVAAMAAIAAPRIVAPRSPEHIASRQIGQPLRQERWRNAC